MIASLTISAPTTLDVGSNQIKTFKKVDSDKLAAKLQALCFSKDIKSLVLKMLQGDPIKRPTIDEVLLHEPMKKTLIRFERESKYDNKFDKDKYESKFDSTKYDNTPNELSSNLQQKLEMKYGLSGSNKDKSMNPSESNIPTSSPSSRFQYNIDYKRFAPNAGASSNSGENESLSGGGLSSLNMGNMNTLDRLKRMNALGNQSTNNPESVSNEMKFDPSKYEPTLDTMKMRMMLNKENNMSKHPLPTSNKNTLLGSDMGLNPDSTTTSQNYVFNSQELYSKFNQLDPKNMSNIPGLQNKKEPNIELSREINLNSQNPSSNLNFINNLRMRSSGNMMSETNNSNNTIGNAQIPTPSISTRKDEYRRVSSEKRTYRTGSNSFLPTANMNLSNNPNTENSSTSIEDYKPKQYKKYTPPNLQEEDDNLANRKFGNTETFSRFSSRPNENETNNLGGNLGNQASQTAQGFGMGFSNLRSKIGFSSGESGGIKKGNPTGDSIGSIGGGISLNNEFKGFGKYGIKGGDNSLNRNDE